MEPKSSSPTAPPSPPTGRPASPTSASTPGPAPSTNASYADKCVQYARFLKAVDPTVKLIAVGADDPDWDLEVLKRAGRVIDFLSIHQYWGRDDHYGTVAASHYVEQRLKLLSSVIDVAEGMLQVERPIEISFDEWNIWYRGRGRPWEEFYALKDGLFAAGVFNAMYRHCTRVTMANLAQMVNALGMMHTTPDALILSPIYHVFDLYANHTGRTVLDTSLTAEDAAARETITTNIAQGIYGRPESRPRVIKGVPYVDVTATLDGSADRPTRLAIAAVNRHQTERATLSVDLGALTRTLAERPVHVHELTGPDSMRQNTVEHPDTVTPTSRSVDRLPERVELSPCSVTIFEWVP